VPSMPSVLPSCLRIFSLPVVSAESAHKCLIDVAVVVLQCWSYYMMRLILYNDMHTHHINHKTGFSKIHPSIKDYHFTLYSYYLSTHLLLPSIAVRSVAMFWGWSFCFGVERGRVHLLNCNNSMKSMLTAALDQSKLISSIYHPLALL